jgi:Tat protein secretion system quality control protein TatD with DNase activity
MFVDTHCHVADSQFDADRAATIERAKATGVSILVEIAESPETWDAAVELSEKYPFIYASLGIHPHHAHDAGPDVFIFAHERLRILGEIQVRKFGADGKQPLDPDGNPDTSFLAKIPADVAWTFQTLDKRGMELSAEGTFERNTKFVSSALRIIKRAEPQAVVMIGTYEPCAKFIQLAHQQGFNPVFYTVSFVGAEELARRLDSKADFTVIMSQVVPPPEGPESADHLIRPSGRLTVSHGFRDAVADMLLDVKQ